MNLTASEIPPGDAYGNQAIGGRPCHLLNAYRRDLAKQMGNPLADLSFETLSSFLRLGYVVGKNRMTEADYLAARIELVWLSLQTEEHLRSLSLNEIKAAILAWKLPFLRDGKAIWEIAYVSSQILAEALNPDSPHYCE